MLSRLAAVAIFVCSVFGAPAIAERLVVVELFTSQGCSSCPPADAMLGELTARDDVLPLALHVDYWDYIGWKDIFADPSHTKRQKAYAYAAGAHTIYTPQIIVGGQDHVTGFKPMKLAMTIDRHIDAPARADVTASRSGGSISVSVSPVGQGGQPCRVLLVSYSPKERVEIRRGENAGRTITYHNIVRDMTVIGEWDGRTTFNATVPAADGVHQAVVVQHGAAGPILAAARVR